MSDDEIKRIGREVHAIGGRPSRLTIPPRNVRTALDAGLPVDIALADPVQVYNFHPGIVLVEQNPGDPSFRLRPATRWELARIRLRNRWEHATRWWRPRTVCSAVDAEAGCITLVTERWSWRRWRWERT